MSTLDQKMAKMREADGQVKQEEDDQETEEQKRVLSILTEHCVSAANSR